MRVLARDESAGFLLYLPTVYLFLSRLFALPSTHIRRKALLIGSIIKEKRVC